MDRFVQKLERGARLFKQSTQSQTAESCFDAFKFERKLRLGIQTAKAIEVMVKKESG